jgi:hypothetical protein
VTQPPKPPSPHAAQVRSWLDNAIREVKGVADVHVVDDVDELRHVIGRGDIPNDVQGVYVSGGRQVWLVADQLGSAAEAQRKFVHEVFGHLAMEHFAPMQEAVRMVQQLRTSPTSTVGKLWDEVSRTQPGLDPTTHAKETIALMAEHGSKHMIIQRLLAAIRDLIRRMGVKLKYSEAQLRQLIANAGRALRESAQRLPEEDDVAAHQADSRPVSRPLRGPRTAHA